MKKMKMSRSAICILDGMGPQAGSYLYSTLIDKAVKEYGAKDNDEFPEIILYSIPVSDFISSEQHKQAALKLLKKKVKETKNLDIACLSIACNTAHILIDELQKESKVPLVSIIEAVGQRVREDKLDQVGLLATPSTIKHELYQKEFKKYGINVILPEAGDVKILETLVRNVLAGKISLKDRKKITLIANSLRLRGAEGIVLGCTELPLLFPKKYSLSIYNSVEILAEALLQKYYKNNIERRC